MPAPTYAAVAAASQPDPKAHAIHLTPPYTIRRPTEAEVIPPEITLPAITTLEISSKPAAEDVLAIFMQPPSPPQPQEHESEWAKLVTLRVGPRKRELKAHVFALNTVPFFKACLDAPMVEKATGVINMPEDDPEEIESILQWAYRYEYDNVLSILAYGNTLNGRYRTLQYIPQYAVAKKLGCDSLCKKILDDMVEACAEASVTFDVVNRAADLLDVEDPLLKTILARAARSMRDEAEKYLAEQGEEYEKFMAGDPEMAKMLVAELVKQK